MLYRLQSAAKVHNESINCHLKPDVKLYKLETAEWIACMTGRRLDFLSTPQMCCCERRQNTSEQWGIFCGTNTAKCNKWPSRMVACVVLRDPVNDSTRVAQNRPRTIPLCTSSNLSLSSSFHCRFPMVSAPRRHERFFHQ